MKHRDAVLHEMARLVFDSRSGNRSRAPPNGHNQFSEYIVTILIDTSLFSCAMSAQLATALHTLSLYPLGIDGRTQRLSAAPSCSQFSSFMTQCPSAPNTISDSVTDIECHEHYNQAYNFRFWQVAQPYKNLLSED
ncbi:MAG: hypothetical protein EZS28_011029 [Streblomastix strix]|uniref:Uncharacterized protein n=1 Tax=Streblomastix strix TaxID=222440 RepID=A0A5J4WEP7_9EUKA|nr:MAG: hypothetical protein EZS28_011029 [Streblomastix strix]